MKNHLKYTALTTLLVLLAVFCFDSNAGAQNKTREDAKQSAGAGIIFKIPENLTPMEKWKDFKAVLMLNLKQPAGAFVAYPNDGETAEELIIRLRTSIAEMFIHGGENAKHDWTNGALPTHDGDKTAQMDLTKSGEQAVQVASYTRENNGLTVVYGYFAMKNDKNKAKGVWLGDDGKGVKEFDKLWKSFPKK